MSPRDRSVGAAGGRRSFETTRWTLVLAAAGDSYDPASREALSGLCESYWYPLYVYVRRHGYDRSTAQDLTQGFFAQLLEKKYLKEADPERGRFRAFLLTSLKNYLANEWDKQRAQKRGGGQTPLSLDFENAEGLYQLEPADERTPEEIYNRRWALTQVDRAIHELRGEMVKMGHPDRFEALKGFLTGESEETPYAEVAESLGLNKGAVRTAVHRMRRRFGALLRRQVAQTLADEKDVDREIRYLLSIGLF